jgi:hypothetical protein
VVMTGPNPAALCALSTATQPRAIRGQTSIASPKRTQAGSVAPVVRPGRPSPSVEAL